MSLHAHLHPAPAMAIPALAQTSPDEEYRRMLQSRRDVTEYLERAAHALTDQRRVEHRVARILGESPCRGVSKRCATCSACCRGPQRTPLNVRVTGTLDKGSYTIEKIAFESMPKVYVTGNLYIPKQRTGKLAGDRLRLRPRLLSAGRQDAIPAARHLVREERIRRVDRRFDPDRRDVWPASWHPIAGDVRLVFPRLHAGRRGGAGTRCARSIIWRSRPEVDAEPNRDDRAIRRRRDELVHRGGRSAHQGGRAR